MPEPKVRNVYIPPQAYDAVELECNNAPNPGLLERAFIWLLGRLINIDEPLTMGNVCPLVTLFSAIELYRDTTKLEGLFPARCQLPCLAVFYLSNPETIFSLDDLPKMRAIIPGDCRNSQCINGLLINREKWLGKTADTHSA
jgi:hypothetical protein